MAEASKVVVLGGGIAGISVALDLAGRGRRVLLIERAGALGGNATDVCCKAIDGTCQLCGGCLLSDALGAIRSEPRVDVLLGTTLAGLSRNGRGLELNLEAASESTSHLSTPALVVATGFDHVDAHHKGPYGYGILPGVISGHDLERRLKDEGQGALDSLPLGRVGFIQCVGSRDEHVGRGYCSQVCCRYALRLARLLKSRSPETEITIFKMDIQSSGRDMQAAYAALGDEGIGLVAGLPAVVRRSAEDPQQVAFMYDDILGNRITTKAYDLLVLSVGMQPRADAGGLAELLGINRDAYGFFETATDGVTTLTPGVFLAGCCGAPRSIAESAAHARVAAEICARYLQEVGA